MSNRRALAFAVFALILPQPPLFAQEEVRNWSAPPFWGASRRPAPPVGLEGRDERLGTMVPLHGIPTHPLPFVGINPCRLLDTRNNVNPLGGGGPFAADETRTYTLPGSCGIPVTVASAVSLNVTVTNTGSGAFGHIKVWPADQVEPNVSTLNYPGPGATLANAAIVPLSETGAINVKSGNASADVILDVNGYYGPDISDICVDEGQVNSIISNMIVDNSIVNADINIDAAIADTKLATIATAGKVADTALSANVTKLGPTIEASEITDIARSVSIPLLSFVDCDTGLAAFLDFTSGADRKADFNGSGSGAAGFNLLFDDDAGQEDQDTEICSQLVMPLDYVSGGQFKFFVGKGGHTGETEILNCAVGRNSFLPPGYGTVTTTTASTTSYTCVPTPQGLQAGDTLAIVLKVTSGTTMDDLVFIYSVAFEYTASQ